MKQSNPNSPDIMAFTEAEIAEHSATLEAHFWAHHRPPLHLRDKVREGQCFDGASIELFFVRPAFNLPGEFVETPIAKLRFIRTRDEWNLYWKRADNKWHRYPPCPETATLLAALHAISKDPHGCFFG